MSRLLNGVWAVGVGLFAVACWGDDDEASGPGDSKPSNGPSSGNTETRTEGAEGETDPYCPHAWNGFEQLDVYLEEMNAIEDDPEMSPARLRDHGAKASEAAELTGEHFTRAAEFVVETEAAEAFDAFLHYQEIYLVPQSVLAAGASDRMSYAESSFELFLSDGVAAATGAGALASGTMSSYTVRRCSSARWR